MRDLSGAPSGLSEAASDVMQRAAELGGYVGIGAAIVTGSLLGISASGNLGLLVCVAVATVAVASLAQRVGQVAGPAIARRSLLPSVGVGIVCGLICLVGCAFFAAFLGLIWAGFDGFRDHYLVRNYLGKPFLAVLGYGLFPAIVVGILSGIVLWGLTRPLASREPQATDSRS